MSVDYLFGMQTPSNSLCTRTMWTSNNNGGITVETQTLQVKCVTDATINFIDYFTLYGFILIMAENVQDKLDADFLFYLSFTKTFFGNLVEKRDIELCQAWLQKLCGESLSGVDAKRDRNVFLSQLVLAMQDGRLSGPFMEPPPDGPLPPASTFFGPVQPDIEEPPWLEEVVEGSGGDFAHTSRDGRTYLATRSLAQGRGSFGYLAVTLAEEEPQWISGGGGAGEGPRECTDETCGKTDEAETVKELLASRPPSEKRTKILQLYRFLMDNVEAVLQGKAEPHSHVLQLLSKIEHQRDAGTDKLPVRDKQRALLFTLRDKLQSRMLEVADREQRLGQAQELVNAEENAQPVIVTDSFWNTTISQSPRKHNIKLLEEHYPQGIVERFLDMLSEEKKKIIDKYRNNHNIAVATMKRELRKDVKEGLDKFVEARNEWNIVSRALRDVQNAQNTQAVMRSHKQAGSEFSATSWKTRVANQLTNQLKQSQKHYEEEMRRGEEMRMLIQAERQSNHLSRSFNTNTLQRLQKDNGDLKGNIRQLQQEILQQQDRLQDLLYIQGM